MFRIKRCLFLLCFINLISISFGVPKFKKYGPPENVPNTGNKRNLKLILMSENNSSSVKHDTNGNCWMTLNAKDHFETMEGIEEKYKTVRDNYQKSLGKSFSDEMLETLLKTRGKATRELFKSRGIDNIPAGLNLGGQCMMRLPESILFFHRLKLRNNTYFRVNMLDIDLVNMVLTTQLGLNDLHLAGAYSRVLTDREPGVMYYTPTYGEVEFLLKDVNFKAEGRLRLIKDRLWIELINSVKNVGDTLMSYTSNKTLSFIRPKNIDDILERVKTDLQKWLKDYFNDFFMFHPLHEPPNSEFQQAEKSRITALNDYADYAIHSIVLRIREMNASSVQIPSFTMRGSNKLVIKLHNGALRGLDTMYRRSVTTDKREGQLRKVNAVIGFSSLKSQRFFYGTKEGKLDGLPDVKWIVAHGCLQLQGLKFLDIADTLSTLERYLVVYKYEAELISGVPPLTGVIILTSDELTGHLMISLVNNPEAVDINIDSLEQMKPESLTVEGSANTLISAYRHVLEHHIIAIMTNTLHHQIKQIRSLPGCIPNIKANLESGEVINDDDNITKKLDNIKETTSQGLKEYDITEQADNSPEFEVTTPMKKKESSGESEKSSETESNPKNPDSIEDDAKKTIKDEANEVDKPDDSELEKDLETDSTNTTNYWLTKNESLEIEVPDKENPGKMNRVKVHRVEEYKVIDK